MQWVLLGVIVIVWVLGNKFLSIYVSKEQRKKEEEKNKYKEIELLLKEKQNKTLERIEQLLDNLRYEKFFDIERR